MLEYAKFAGAWYGTPRKPVEEKIKNMTEDELYDYTKCIINSQDCRELTVTNEYITLVRYILKEKNKKFLDRLFNDNKEPEFSCLYRDSYINGKKHFERIADPIESFALAWLFFKYH